MVKVVLKGSELTSEKPYISLNLREREYILEEKFQSYRKGATLTGAAFGAAANYKLLNRLFYVGKNSYRLRILKKMGLL